MENKISIGKIYISLLLALWYLKKNGLPPPRPGHRSHLLPVLPEKQWWARNQKRRSLPHAYQETHPARTCNLRRNYSTLDPGNPLTPCKRYNTSQPHGIDSTRIPRLLEQEGAAPLKTIIVYFFSCFWLRNHKEVVDGIYKTPWDYKCKPSADEETNMQVEKGEERGRVKDRKQEREGTEDRRWGCWGDLKITFQQSLTFWPHCPGHPAIPLSPGGPVSPRIP